MSWADDFIAFSQQNIDESVSEALYGRGLSPEQILEFKLGFIEGSFPSGIDPKFVQWAKGNKLKDSFVLPLTNSLSEVLGFQFRSIDKSKKGYLDYFLSKDEPVLFGLGQAVPHIWSSESICVVEGAFDLFPVQRVLPYTVGTITAKITAEFLRWVFRLVRKVYLFYDADKTGREACWSFVGEHRTDFDRLQVMEYPRGVTLYGKFVKDPADLWEAWGDDRLKQHILKQVME